MAPPQAGEAGSSSVQASSDTNFQVVILAGGECKRLYPLTSAGTLKALLPVGNLPLISYPLRNLAQAGIRRAIVVAIGEAVSSSLTSYLAAQEAALGVACQVITVPEDCGTADALRLVAPQLGAPTTVVYSADTLTDTPLRALVLEHQVSGALATVLVGPRRTSPASETKPGKPPRGVDYLGLDPASKLLLFAASSPEALRELKLPLAAVAAAGSLQLRSDLTDQHMYVFSRPALKLLTSKASLSSLKLDFIPWLTRHCLKASSLAAAVAAGGSGGLGDAVGRSGSGLAGCVSPAEAALARHGSGFLLSRTGSFGASPAPAGSGAADSAAGSGRSSDTAGVAGAGGAADAAAAAGAASKAPSSAAGELGDAGDGSELGWPWLADVGMGLPGVLTGLGLPGEGYMALSHAGPAAVAAASRAGRVGVHLVPHGRYCARVNSVQAYGEVNRDVAASDTALHLTGLGASKYENVVPPSVLLGAKATIGPACIVGEGCVIGDKTSVKRSVLGANCRLGSNAKVINCVLMDGVVVGDGAHVQNCVVCGGVVVQERATLKDCQVGPGFVVAQASDHRSETLAKT